MQFFCRYPKRDLPYGRREYELLGRSAVDKNVVLIPLMLRMRVRLFGRKPDRTRGGLYKSQDQCVRKTRQAYPIFVHNRRGQAPGVNPTRFAAVGRRGTVATIVSTNYKERNVSLLYSSTIQYLVACLEERNVSLVKSSAMPIPRSLPQPRHLQALR